jgi:uncharacterized membrane protein YvlD (DUF360 family)
MKKRFLNFLNDSLALQTSILSGIICLLYIWKSCLENFSVGISIVIAMDFIYIPLAIFFGRKCISYFYLFYSIALIFITAFEKTFLFNNFTALFIVCIVISLHPKIEKPALAFYFLAITISFSLNEEKLYHFLIHVTRSVIFIISVRFIMTNEFQKRKKLILSDDEIKIIEQLANGKTYQKEVTGFSENTVYRKLKAARERNGNITREQLLDLYVQQQA